jgi:SAM-dependent methyltransferase
MDTSIDSRLARERDYHNQRFADETREAQGKYYAAVKDGAERFDSELHRLARSADILEYGCGNDPKLFSVAATSRSATGIDISDVAVAHAAERAEQAGLANTGFHTMNAEQMTFADNSFDLVFGRGIIHHLDTDRSFAEIARVLRPHGTALFWEPLGHNLLLSLYRVMTPEARTPDEHPLLRADFDLAHRHFGEVALSFFGLTTILSVPFRDTKLGDAILGVASVVDRAMFRIPGMKWQAWHCLMEMRMS